LGQSSPRDSIEDWEAAGFSSRTFNRACSVYALDLSRPHQAQDCLQKRLGADCACKPPSDGLT